MADVSASTQTVFPKGLRGIAPGGCIAMLLPIKPDSQPGNNTLTITGLAGAKAISLWITELYPGQPTGVFIPRVGGGIFETHSVQLDAFNNICRVIYTLNWNSPLLSGAMVIAG